MKKKALVLIISILTLAALFATLVGCNAKEDVSYYDTPENDGIAPKNGTSGAVVIGEVTRKVYYTVDLELYSSDMAATAALVKTKTAEFEGYVQSGRESSGEYGAYYYFTVRIPTNKLNDFEAAISEGSRVADRYVTTTDITTQYVSAQARVEALEAERDALQALTPADTADVIAIYDRISTINAELSALEKELNEYDSLIDYSTVNIRIYKEQEEEKDERSFAKKMADLFVASFKSMGKVGKGLATVITAVFPYFLVLSLAAGIVFGIIILVRKKKGLPLFPTRRRKVKELPAKPVEEKKEESKEKEE